MVFDLDLCSTPKEKEKYWLSHSTVTRNSLNCLGTIVDGIWQPPLNERMDILKCGLFSEGLGVELISERQQK